MSLKTKFSLIFLGFVAVVLGVFASAYVVLETRSEIRRMRKAAFEKIGAIAIVCRESHLNSNWIGAINRLKLEQRNPSVLEVECLDLEGRVRASTNASRIGHPQFLPKDLKQFLLSPTQKTTTRKGAADTWLLTAPVKLGGRPAGIVRMVFDLAYLQEQIQSNLVVTLERMLQVAGITLFLALFLAFAVAWSLNRPIQGLVEATRHIKAGDLDYHSPIAKRKDELGDLAKRFDDMALTLKELERMRKQFIDGITHDLKSPLMVIMSYLELFIETKKEKFTEKELHQLQIAQASSQRLRDYIQNMLDYSKLGAGNELPMKVQELDLHPIFDTIAQSLEVTGKILDLEIRWGVEPSLPKIYGDEEMVRRVISNLSSNAMKFTSKGGRITIGAAYAEEEGFVRVWVQDTGVGIPKEDLSKVFKKFFQVESTRSEAKETGTGLGLSICQQIISQHRGNIWVDSKVGAGTTFSFTLPTFDFTEKTADPSPAETAESA